MSNSVQPHRWQPTRLPIPGIRQGKNTGVGCHFLLQCMKVKSESEITQLCPTLATPWTAAYQAPPSMGFSRQEYWSGVPLPSPKYGKHFKKISKVFCVCCKSYVVLIISLLFTAYKSSSRFPPVTECWIILWMELPKRKHIQLNLRDIHDKHFILRGNIFV